MRLSHDDPHPAVVHRASDAVRMLRDDDALEIAPHVAAHLVRRLGGDRDGIRQTAHALSVDQRNGTVAPPDPLPLVPAVSARYSPAVDALDQPTRTALLIACVSVSRRTDVLLAASGLGVDDLVGDTLSPFLELVSGHFLVRDPRIRSYVHETASLAERTAAHFRLAAALGSTGRSGLASWHAALATLEGRAALAPDLIALARTALRRGDSIWAFRVAREATSQAGDDNRLEAELVAGISALLSGFVIDAVYWLGRVLRAQDRRLARRALAPYVAAVTFSTGYVPDAEIVREEAALATYPGGDLAVLGALAIAAALHAERGNRDEALDALHRGERLAVPQGSAFMHVARSWCAAFGVGDGPVIGADWPDPATIEPRWLAGYLEVSRGLGRALDGDTAGAEALLSTASLRWSRDTAAAVDSGPEVAATPLLEAHLQTATALIAIAAGRFSPAIDLLETAAAAGPVALVLGNIHRSASGRMSVVTSGDAARDERCGDAGPTPALRRGSLVDRAYAAAFADRPGDAAALLSLAGEITANRIERSLPEPDECLLLVDSGQLDRAEEARRALGRAGLESSANWLPSLRASLALSPPHQVTRLREPAADACRGLGAVYERATTELALSRALTRSGDPDAAHTHGVAALELFFQTGATALTSWARVLLSRNESREPLGVPTGDWSRDLTEREQQVAALVVLGTTNRDVAHELHLSVRTVEVHLARIFTKLDVHSRTELSYLVHGRATPPHPETRPGLRRTT